MYAIIETGGKQYRVENGDQIAVENWELKTEQSCIRQGSRSR